MNIEKIAKAIEADAGEALLYLRQALAEAKARTGRVTSPEVEWQHLPLPAPK